MAIKIVREIPFDKGKSGNVVTAAQIEELSQNLFCRLFIKDGPDPSATSPAPAPNDIPRQMDCSDRNNQQRNDTKTAYFKKKDIYKLFRKHKGSNGLLISFGIHNSKIYGPLRECTYENKLMVVLITAENKKPNLNVNDLVMIAGALDSGGDGMDNGKLCPPDTTC